MKKANRILALVLALAMLTSLFIIHASAENKPLDWETEHSEEIILTSKRDGAQIRAFRKEGENGNSIIFKPEESGLYRIMTGEPESFWGKLFNSINPIESDPRVEISGEDGWAGYADDNAQNGSMQVDAYIYLRKGETYWLSFADAAAIKNVSFFGLFSFNIPLYTAFKLDVEFVGSIKSVSVNPATKLSYSVSKGEVSYDADSGEYTDINTQIAVDVRLTDGTTMTFDDYETGSLYNVMDYFWTVLPEIKVGVNAGTIHCLDKELAFVFTVVR